MTNEAPERLLSDSSKVAEVLQLVRASFAYMEGRIDPPSSMHRLTESAISEQCRTGEVWILGTPVHTCIFLTAKEDALYIGKLAVDQTLRNRGLGQRMIDLAENRARRLGLKTLELETRIELTENHQAFERMGFSKTAEAAHSGYDRVTYIVMRKDI